MKLNEISLERHHILVFRSNIDNNERVKLVCCELTKMKGIHHVNVDLDDWEKVLRVECDAVIQASLIVKRLFLLGFDCSELTH